MIFRAKISPLRHGGLAGDAGDLGADQSGACCKEDAGLIDCRLFHSGATTLGPYRGQVFQEALAEYGATATGPPFGLPETPGGYIRPFT